jgi:hypothetical protein
MRCKKACRRIPTVSETARTTTGLSRWREAPSCHYSSSGEAPVGIEPTNSRFAVLSDDLRPIVSVSIALRRRTFTTLTFQLVSPRCVPPLACVPKHGVAKARARLCGALNQLPSRTAGVKLELTDGDVPVEVVARD